MKLDLVHNEAAETFVLISLRVARLHVLPRITLSVSLMDPPLQPALLKNINVALGVHLGTLKDFFFFFLQVFFQFKMIPTSQACICGEKSVRLWGKVEQTQLRHIKKGKEIPSSHLGCAFLCSELSF